MTRKAEDHLILCSKGCYTNLAALPSLPTIIHTCTYLYMFDTGRWTLGPGRWKLNAGRWITFSLAVVHRSTSTEY
jgi:hypothetical protein